jgi:hypothetical protein
MSVFGRTAAIDKMFASTAQWLAVGMIVANCYFTWGYLQGRLGIGNEDLKFIASVTVSILVTIVEATTFSALFNPDQLAWLLGRNKETINHPDSNVVSISTTSQNAALVGLCVISVLAFWFDYNASISQLKVQNTLEARVIAGVFVIGGEILFACQNILLQSSKKEAIQDKRREKE